MDIDFTNPDFKHGPTFCLTAAHQMLRIEQDCMQDQSILVELFHNVVL